MSLLSKCVIVLAAVVSVAHGNTDASDHAFLKTNLNTTSGTNTYAQAINYGQTHPTRDGGSWSQWCGSLMVRAGNLPDASVCPSAIDAYHKSTIISKDPYAAPSGAFHYWDIGTYGHVAMATTNGWAMMASCHVSESWGDCIGVTSVTGYTSNTGASYLGWAYDYARAEIADVHHPVPPSSGCSVPQTSTQQDGIPGPNYYARQQCFAALYGYTGPKDGVMGQNSWASTQAGLHNYGYTGPNDGIPGTNTYIAMQHLAANYGYTGPADGALGSNSYKALAKYFNTL